MDHWVQILMIRQNKYNIQNNVQKHCHWIKLALVWPKITLLYWPRREASILPLSLLSVCLSFSFLSPEKLRHVKSEQFSQQASHKWSFYNRYDHDILPLSVHFPKTVFSSGDVWRVRFGFDVLLYRWHVSPGPRQAWVCLEQTTIADNKWAYKMTTYLRQK